MSGVDPGRKPPVDWWERIEEAKVLLGSSSGRQEARRLLEDIASKAQGTPAALEAMGLLRQTDGDERILERKSPETEALRQEWLPIVTPLDVRLPSFLNKLRQHPNVLAELLPEVASVLRRWFGSTSDEIRASLDDTGRGPDESRLEAMEGLAAFLSETPSFDAELRNDLLRFREARFRLLLAQLESEIQHACQVWDVDRAWQLMERLDGAGAICEDEVRRIEQTVYDADALRTEVEAGLSRWKPERPLQWAGLRVLLESLAEVRRFLGDPRIPPDWIETLRRQGERLVSDGRAFLQEQAGRARNVKETARVLAQLSADRSGWHRCRAGRAAGLV